MPSRRGVLQSLLGCTLLAAPGLVRSMDADVVIRLNLPGPGSLPFLPLELIPKLGFDAEMGTRLILRYQPSGVRALEDVLAGNADFAALGFPTLPVLATKGKEAVAIAPLAGIQHTFQLIVRKDLAKRLRNVADLKGRTVGVSTGSQNSKTYMQMLMTIMLAAAHIRSDQVRWLAMGQNWESISGALLSQAADVVFCEQPFPFRLLREGLGQTLADLADPQVARNVTGIDALRSTVATHRRVLDHAEAALKAERMVRMIRRALVWLHSTAPTDVARQAVVRHEQERAEISGILQRTPRIYSSDGRFLDSQIRATDLFLQAALGTGGLAPAAHFVDDRWAGRRS